MKTVTVLVVDDQAIIADDLVMKVGSMGYSGSFVSSGEEAIKKISLNFKPDVILMDVTLKGRKNGIQTARVIRKFKKIPVLFVTAHTRSSILAQIQDLDLTGYLQKPFCKEDLQVSIRRLLDAP